MEEEGQLRSPVPLLMPGPLPGASECRLREVPPESPGGTRARGLPCPLWGHRPPRAEEPLEIWPMETARCQECRIRGRFQRCQKRKANKMSLS